MTEVVLVEQIDVRWRELVVAVVVAVVTAELIDWKTRRKKEKEIVTGVGKQDWLTNWPRCKHLHTLRLVSPAV